MKRSPIAVLLLTCVLSTGATGGEPTETAAGDYDALRAQMSEAIAAEDYAGLADLLEQALAFRPASQSLVLNRVLALTLARRPSEAIDVLERFADRGLALPMDGHPSLVELAARPDAREVIDRMDANRAPRGTSELHLEVDETGLLPEAVWTDGRTTLVGSVRSGRILEVVPGGEPREFARLPGGVFDLHVTDDAIWAAVSNGLAYRRADGTPAPAPRSGVVVLERDGGDVRSEVWLDQEAVFGDLEVAPDGTAWVSDSVTPRVLRWAPGTSALEVAIEDSRFVNLQGLALDAESGVLFIADYLGGLFRAEPASGRVTRLGAPDEVFLGGIDGLYRAGPGRLIGIQNGTTPQRIVCMTMSGDSESIDGMSVLARALPMWNEPTHGQVVGGALVYIATSNWPSYDGEFDVLEGNPPKPLRLMRVGLPDSCGRSSPEE